MSTSNKVAYIYSNQLRYECDRLPTMRNRASMVQDLILSYGLFQHPKLALVKSTDASDEDLLTFHSHNYIEFLKKVNDLEDFSKVDGEQLNYGLGYDCPILEKNFDFIKTVAGGSLTAATLLAAEKCTVAINWFGGWHHAQRDGAEGFCYVNDVVLAIKKLSETFDKILYIDFDIHHGNGVQDAFYNSKRVITLSLHKMSPGFYPSTGHLDDVGNESAKFYTVNVPLKEGVGHNSYVKIFDTIFPKVISTFQPDCIVVQCGADGLCGDPIGQTNLTLETYGHCVKQINSLKLPTLYLGGGGYNFPNTARLWTYLTSILLNCSLFNDIPDCSKYFPDYVPSYELHINSGNMKDTNSDDYIETLITTIRKNCESIN